MDFSEDFHLYIKTLINHIKKAKIYYVPGLISSILVPLYFSYLISRYNNASSYLRNKYSASSIINYSVPSDSKNSNYLFSGVHIIKEINKKKLITFYLDSDYLLNSKKIHL